jgi:hypothetical protein
MRKSPAALLVSDVICWVPAIGLPTSKQSGTESSTPQGRTLSDREGTTELTNTVRNQTSEEAKPVSEDGGTTALTDLKALPERERTRRVPLGRTMRATSPLTT